MRNVKYALSTTEVLSHCENNGGRQIIMLVDLSKLLRTFEHEPFNFDLYEVLNTFSKDFTLHITFFASTPMARAK